MGDDIRVWFKDRAEQAIDSIAFYPAFIGLLFLLFSWATLSLDFSEAGRQIKQNLPLLTLTDPTAAQSIVSAIASGLITLTVFNFSMVMIVLNQAASQLSNRVLTELIGSRFPQIVLGIYIGTIVYAFSLLSSIRNATSGVHIPALSTYVLILLTIIDIFIFIYFLHYITQSVRYEIIIERIYQETIESLEADCYLSTRPKTATYTGEMFPLPMRRAGVFEGFDAKRLFKIARQHDCVFRTMRLPGTYLLAGLPVLECSIQLSDKIQEEVWDALSVHRRESIDNNYFYSLRQLMETAVKALSPAINDPGTAILGLRAIFDLFSYRASHFPAGTVKDSEGQDRIFIEVLTFERVFEDTILPIWQYGRDDRLVQRELRRLLTQLQQLSPHEVVGEFLQEVQERIYRSGE